MKQNRLVLITFLLIIIIASTGCNIFSDFWKYSNDKSSSSDPGIVLFDQTISANKALNFANNGFRLEIPVNANSDDVSLQIKKYPQNFLQIPGYESNLQLSEIFSFRTGSISPKFTRPAKITIPIASSGILFSNENVFLACKTEQNSWSFISPEISLNKTEISASIGHFSDWLVFERKTILPGAPNRAPEVISSPSILIASSSGFFEENILVEVGFSTSATYTLSLGSYKFTADLLIPDSTTLVARNPENASYSIELKTSAFVYPQLDLINNSAVAIKQVANHATASFLIVSKGLALAQLPSSFILRAHLTDPNGKVYETEVPIYASSNSQASSLIPAINRTYPSNNASDVSIATDLKLYFNTRIDQESFKRSLIASPTLLFKDPAWLSSSLVQLFPQQPLKLDTPYDITITTNLKSYAGYEMQKDFSFSFRTSADSDLTAPEITFSYPNNKLQQISKNSELRIHFSESMDRESVEKSFDWTSATGGFEFLWSPDSRILSAIPINGWNTGLNYLKIQKSCADQSGNPLASDHFFEINSSNLLGASFIQTQPEKGETFLTSSLNELKFSFSSPVSIEKLSKSFSIQPDLQLTPTMSLSSDKKELSILFAQGLPDNTSFIVDFSELAKDENDQFLGRSRFSYFSTGDFTAPTISKISPASGSANLSNNSEIQIVFSEDMNPRTVEKSIKVLDFSDGITISPISGNFAYSIKPTTSWPVDKTLTFEVSNSATDVSGKPLSKTYYFNLHFSNILSPSLSYTPLDSQVAISSDSKLIFNFSVAMATNTVESNFSISPTIPLNFSWTADNKTLQIYPSSGNWISGKEYSWNLASKATDLTNGLRLVQDYFSKFKINDTSPPALFDSEPKSNASNVSRNTSIVLTFTEEVSKSSFESALQIYPTPSSTPSFIWTPDGKRVQVTYQTGLLDNTKYSITLNTSLKDIAGNPVTQDIEFSFTTGDSIAPSITQISPASGSILFANSPIQLTFSEKVASPTFAVVTSPGSVLFDLQWADNYESVSILPKTRWPASTTIMLLMSSGLEDISGNSTTKSFSFSYSINSISLPAILNSSPPDNFRIASISTNVFLSFTLPMNQSVTESAVTVIPAMADSPTYFWNTQSAELEIRFPANLSFETDYSIQVATKAASIDGLPLSNPFVLNFRTLDSPKVLSSDVLPGENKSNIATNTVLKIPFNTQMNKVSVQSAFSLTDNQGNSVSVQFQWIGDTLYVTPSAGLSYNKDYLIRISSNAKSSEGFQIQSAFTRTFKTENSPAFIATEYSPASNSANVSLTEKLIIKFNNPVATSTFSLSISPAISGIFSDIWSSDLKTLTREYFNGYANSTTYNIALNSSTTDVYGNNLVSSSGFSFSTLTSTGPRLTSTNPAHGDVSFNPATSLILTFDQSMNNSSTKAAISLQPSPGSSPSFSWSSDNKTLTLNYGSTFSYNTNYQLTVASSAMNASNINLIKSYSIDFKTIAKPVISSTVPTNLAGDIASNSTVTINFSMEMDKASVESSFSISSSTQAISGAFSWNSNTELVFTPSSSLPQGSEIVIKIASSAKSLNNLTLASDFTFKFNVISDVRPRVKTTSPANLQQNVAYNADVIVEFDTPMNSSSVEVIFTPSLVSGFSKNWSSDFKTLTISPSQSFVSKATYQVAISTSSTSLSGSLIEGSTSFTFVAEEIIGAIALSVTPASGTINVPVNSVLTINFNKAMNTVSAAQNFSFSPNPGTANFSWAPDNKIATISIPGIFDFSTLYTASIATAALDFQNQQMQKSFVMQFKTEAKPKVESFSVSNNASNIATDSSILINFNKPMNQIKTQQAVELLNGFTPETCSFSWSGNSLSCRGNPSFSPDASYTIIIDNSGEDLNGNVTGQTSSVNFSTVKSPAFVFNNITPASGSTNIPVNTQFSLFFSNSVKTSTFNPIFVPSPTGGVNIAWDSTNTRATLSPGGNLAGNQNYQIYIASTTLDQFNKPLGMPLNFKFTTEVIPGPSISSTTPDAGSIDVPVNQTFNFAFDREMAKSTVESAFSISPSASGTPTFTWTPDSRGVNIAFSQNLAHNLSYLLKISSSAKDTSNLTLEQDFLLPFKTVSRPEVLLSQLQPLDAATNVSTQTTIVTVFSKTMDQTSCQNAFTMKQGGTDIPGTFAWDGNKMIFTPSSPLAFSTSYQLNIDSSAKDSSNNFILSPYSWSFSTIGREGEVWRQDVAQAYVETHFSSRRDHSVIEFNNYLWCIGGNDGEFLNDVWRSSDGVSWTRELASTSTPLASQFEPRAGHSCVVFNGKIWLIGGYSETESGIAYYDDVWNSVDGRNWTKVVAAGPFFKRAFHSVCVFNNQIWILGGVTIDANENPVYLDDSWKTSDGSSWTEGSQIVSFFPRIRASCGVINGKMWLWGGYGKNQNGVLGPLNDIWSSSNGNLWLLENINGPFAPRCSAATVFFKNRYWLIGGADKFSGSSITFFNDIWTTSDGFNFIKVLENEPATGVHFSKRGFSQSASVNGRMFIAGGENSASGFLNEVWSSE